MACKSTKTVRVQTIHWLYLLGPYLTYLCFCYDVINEKIFLKIAAYL